MNGSSVSLTQHRQGEDQVRGLSASMHGSRPTSASLMLAEKDSSAGTDPPGDKSVSGAMASPAKTCWEP